MPRYVINGQVVWMKGTKLPPACYVCHDMSGYQCDGHVGGNHTCDRHLCNAHATEVRRNVHLCPECLAANPQRDLPLLESTGEAAP